MSNMVTMQELEGAIEKMAQAMSALDVSSPKDIPDEAAGEFDECIETLARGLVGWGDGVEASTIEILGQKMERRLKALYPDKPDQSVVTIVKLVVGEVAARVVQLET